MLTSFSVSYMWDILRNFVDNAEFDRIQEAIQHIAARGGRALLVGGAVRDLILESTPHDIDIEVHGFSLEQLIELLSALGHVDLIGKSFGVVRWQHSKLDWSIPRRDSAGRKPQVAFDPTLSVHDALKRRDLTINAMALDLHTGQLLDPFNGQQDLILKRARSPDIQFFTEDPLRFYRIMQFIGRFELSVDPALNAVCKTMAIASVSQERIYLEFDKLFLYAARPSLGIRWLELLERLSEILPHLAATVSVPQEREWHPEGNVFEHLMQALDAAAEEQYATQEQKLLVLSAALFHDLGKVTATRFVDGKIRSRGHAQEGAPLAAQSMQRITGNKKRKAAVSKLVYHHMDPLGFIKNRASGAAYKRLALALAPEANLEMLIQLFSADRRGRNGDSALPLAGPIADVEYFAQRVQELGLLYAPQPRLLTGVDLLEYFTEGAELGKALDWAYQTQITGNIDDKTELKRRVLTRYKKFIKNY